MSTHSRYDLPDDSERPGSEQTDFLEVEQYHRRRRAQDTRALAATGPLETLRHPAPAERPPEPQRPLSTSVPLIPENTVPTTPPAVAVAAPPAYVPSIPLPPTAFAPPPRAPRRADNLQWVMFALAALAITLMLGLFGFVGVRLLFTNPQSGAPAEAVAGPGGAPTSGGRVEMVYLPTSAVAAPETPTIAPTPTLGVTIEPWDGHERFTVLLLGLDRRPYQTGTAFRTDSMILVSLDPATQQVGMLSVPRDLYVEIPGDSVVGGYYGLQRVNAAYFLGEQVRPGSGPTLAMQTVQYNLGIRVHDYVVYDFEAIIALIDLIGGIDIDVSHDIVDYEYPDMETAGYDPLFIPAGHHHMDGATALKYARTRHGSSDIDRARRQQQVIQAIRSRVLDAHLLPEMLLRAPTVWADLSQHVRSGLGLDQILRLIVYASAIPPENIRQGIIDYSYVQDILWNGAAVLVPDRAAIGPLLVEVFGANYNR